MEIHIKWSFIRLVLDGTHLRVLCVVCLNLYKRHTRLDVRRHFFTEMVINDWNQLCTTGSENSWYTTNKNKLVYYTQT